MALLEDVLEQESKEAGWLREKLQIEGNQATLLCGWLTQANQQ